jgi:hypothetical protein
MAVTTRPPAVSPTRPSQAGGDNVAAVTTVAGAAVSQDRAEAAAGHLFDAECALHVARQSRVDAWIAAASDRLHDAVLEHDQALTARGTGSRR